MLSVLEGTHVTDESVYDDDRDGTLPTSLYNYPRELVFVAPRTLLVADRYNNKLRLVAMNSDLVTT